MRHRTSRRAGEPASRRLQPDLPSDFSPVRQFVPRLRTRAGRAFSIKKRVGPADSPVRPSFYRPCWAEIDLEALRSNFRFVKSLLKPGVGMLAVVKANSYGHGILPVSKVAVEEGAAYLGVSSLEEGVELQRAGIGIPILILGSMYPFDNFSVLFEHRLTPTVASLEAAQALDQLAAERGEKLPVHLKIDSGFGRIGVSVSNAGSFIQRVAAHRGLILEGIYTHFASSDVDPEYTQAQSRAFEQVVQAAVNEGIAFRYVHMANSAALLRYPKTQGTMVRPGLALYGIPPYAEAPPGLKPVLAWKSRIIFLKTIPAGSSVSYARCWTAARSTRVATIAAGYADGFPRILSNKGQVLIQGRRVPVIGRVTMDMTMIDVTDLPECHVGDEVVLLGRQGDQELRAGDMAEAAQTNAYEILCGIGERVPRVYLHGRN